MAGARKLGGSQGTKAQLKAIGEALRQQKYDEAIQQAKDILEADPTNYQALIFLGFSLDKSGKLDDAVPVYENAAKVKPTDPQAWQGLIKVFEKQGTRSLTKYKLAAVRLAEIFKDSDEMYKCQDVVIKFVDFARIHAEGRQLVEALSIQLPDSPIYAILEGRLPRPATTYETIARILEADEARRINTLVGERRTRLGARLVEVTAEVKREVFSESQLTDVYNSLINWTNDDELRRTYEEKLLSYRVERLGAFVGDSKAKELAEVRKLASGMVIIKHAYQLAWDITIDWEDLAEIGDWDVSLLWEYYKLFPTSGLGKALCGFLTSDLSPFSQKEPPKDEEDEKTHAEVKEEKTKDADVPENEPEPEAKTTGSVAAKQHEDLPKTDEERLALLLSGIAHATSLLAYRMAGLWYQHSEDFLDNIALMRAALQYVDVQRAQTGLQLQNSEDALMVYLATALIYYQRPRNHAESKQLFESVLAHNAQSTPSLVGVGLIDEDELDYDSAISFLERALAQDSSDLRVRSEAAWVYSLRGEHAYAAEELEACIPLLADKGLGAKKLLALTQYRLGACLWQLDGSKAARKSRHGPYKYFLSALKNDLHLAPAYTSLGVYYADYAKDRKRAYKCFMKALELDAGELESGRRLVQWFADKRDWESIALVAQRVVESGKATPPWGSKKKAHSWPFAALGTAQLHQKEYNKAMMSFRTATRLDVNDYHSFVALAETYLRVRMYYSAVRAIEQARRIETARGPEAGYEGWYTEYLLANVYRGAAEHDKAIGLYEDILIARAEEPGVLIALMHAMVESADSAVRKGLFGEATSRASETLARAQKMAGTATAQTAGFWTAVASACAVFSTVQGRVREFPAAVVRQLLGDEEDGHAAYAFLQDVDGVGTGVVAASGLFAKEEQVGVELTRCVQATILAFKRALHATATARPSDAHMQAAAHYNLGWAEYRAHRCLPAELRAGLNGYLRAAIRGFKRAIELEAGSVGSTSSRRFWNGLGVATSGVHAPIAQHALARSLYLGRGRAAVWANYGALALLHGDAELANRAFGEGQSSDPDEAASWLGQAFVALAYGEAAEARSLAGHALELSDATGLAVRQQYALGAFDGSRAKGAKEEGTGTELIRPLIGLEQVCRLQPQALGYEHLFALFRERVADAGGAATLLEGVCAALEADYEATESTQALQRFAVAKADLARTYVALGEWKQALASGEEALQLGGAEGEEGGSSTGLSAAERAQLRLSTHVSGALSRFFRGDVLGAQAEMEALDAAGDSVTDSVCLRAQVLWAVGTDEARQQAQDLLFDVVAAELGHVQAVLLLGAMAAQTGDVESAEAVAAELVDMQRATARRPADEARISDVLQALAGDGAAQKAHAQREIMLQPHLPHGWSCLAEEDGSGTDGDDDDDENFAADMALRLTRRLVPPRGDLRPDDLAQACVGTRRLADAQVAIAVAPWLRDGWQALAEGLA